MKNVNFKLQNLIFYYDERLDNHWWMLYRNTHMKYNKMESSFSVPPKKNIEFFTYFNSFSLGKWKKFTKVNNIYLNLRCKGKFNLRLFGHYRSGSEILREDYDIHYFNLDEMTDISVMIPKDSMAEIIGWEIDTLNKESKLEYIDENGEVIPKEKIPYLTKNQKHKLTVIDNSKISPENYYFHIESGYWSTVIPENEINDVRIAIASTTFKKEAFITRNIDVLERELFYSDEPAKDHIRMNIVDNGRTLEPELYNSEYIHIFPNQNVGGSGGFTRGMLESMQMEWKPTHVLLMDDDVRIMPESLIRTYTLLAMVKDEFSERYISGGMLFMEADKMNLQHEDIGFVHADGSYGPNKPLMALHSWDCVFQNDELRSTEYANDSYAGWWYCCIPVKTIKPENNLPLPVFIRGDDVEFSIANNAKFISLNGICIWHLGFANKFTGSLELYQVHRNSLILQAMSGICQDKDFVKRIDECFFKEISRFSYNNCELLLDSIEDYCKGPDFLRDPSQGERCMKEHGAKNEKMLPCEREYPSIHVEWENVYKTLKDIETKTKVKVKSKENKDGEETYYEEEITLTDSNYKEMTSFEKWWYKSTCNGQRGLLKNAVHMKGTDGKPSTAVIAYDWFDDPQKQLGADQILAVNPFEKTAFLRKRNPERFNELMKRHDRVLKYYYQNKKSIAESYRNVAGELKSEKFWREYLNMEKKQN